MHDSGLPPPRLRHCKCFGCSAWGPNHHTPYLPHAALPPPLPPHHALDIHPGVSTHDLHATLLHQLGLDHERLTYRFQGRDFRLTDVHGELVPGILA